MGAYGVLELTFGFEACVYPVTQLVYNVLRKYMFKMKKGPRHFKFSPDFLFGGLQADRVKKINPVE